MWLVNAQSGKLEFFNSELDPPGGYAILSHTWGNEEVTFQDLERGNVNRGQGWRKIEYTCKQALQDGLHYAWVDTCKSGRRCIHTHFNDTVANVTMKP